MLLLMLLLLLLYYYYYYYCYYYYDLNTIVSFSFHLPQVHVRSEVFSIIDLNKLEIYKKIVKYRTYKHYIYIYIYSAAYNYYTRPTRIKDRLISLQIKLA